ncbi:helix-turn-helix domain-containing protein [Mycolicibacterium elephantis]
MSSWFRSTQTSEALLAEERLVLSATEMVHEAMAAADKNKQELAELLGVRPSEVSQRLSGRRNLTLRTLARMLHVLGFRVELKLKPSAPAVVKHQDTPFISIAEVKTSFRQSAPQTGPICLGPSLYYLKARIASINVNSDDDHQALECCG